MPTVKKVLPVVTEIWVQMDTQKETRDQQLDFPLVIGLVGNKIILMILGRPSDTHIRLFMIRAKLKDLSNKNKQKK